MDLEFTSNTVPKAIRSEGRYLLSSLPLQTGLRRRPVALASHAHYWLLIRGLLLREGHLVFFLFFFFRTRLSSISMTSNSNLSNMRRMVEQLKLEASVERIKVKNVTETSEAGVLWIACQNSCISSLSVLTDVPMSTRGYDYFLFTTFSLKGIALKVVLKVWKYF